jgi:ribosomal protein L40E
MKSKAAYLEPIRILIEGLETVAHTHTPKILNTTYPRIKNTENTKMVYCTKCGTKNPDDAKTCSQCGAPLYSIGEREQRRRNQGECFGTRRAEEPYRRVQDECFGIPRGGTIVALAFGIIIVLAGISFLFQELYNIAIPWWPFVVILFGILIIIGAIYGLRRRY